MPKTVNRLVKGEKNMMVLRSQPSVAIAVIGCGGISCTQHIPAIQTEVPGLRIVGLCDSNSSRLASAMDIFGIASGTTDYHEVLARPDVEAVCIATGTETLVDLARDALAHGKHVFVEKPLASASDKAAVLATELSGAAVKFQVAFNRRFAVGCREGRRLITEGLLGEPLSIHFRFWFDRPTDPRNIVDDLLLHVGIHTFDLCQYFLGPIDLTSVTAQLKVDRRQGALAVLFRYASGATGSIQLSSAGSWLYPGERIEIVGAERTAIVDNLSSVTVVEQDGKALVTAPCFSAHWASSRELSGFAPQLRDFAACILEDRAPLVGYTDALQALQLSERVRQLVS